MMARYLLVPLLALAAVLVAISVMAEEGTGEMGPMVDRPTDRGPYSVHIADSSIQTTTKSYATDVRYYYPGRDGGPDRSNAPYPTIIWLPGFGGSRTAYREYTEHMSSYGMVVMAVSVNWNDWPRSANVADMEDFLDHLEAMNSTPGSFLEGMVDIEAFGLSGHSSGGGLSLVDGAQVDRIRAVQPLAAAIAESAVDSIAPLFDKPLLLQVGKEDAAYIDGSERAYDRIDAPNSLVEIIGAGHGGPYETHLLVAFYLYWLDDQEDYWTFCYGPEAVVDAANHRVDLWFKLNASHFFPPLVTGLSVSKRDTVMDETVWLNATLAGYQVDSPLVFHRWDVDGDGAADVIGREGANVTYAFTEPGEYRVNYTYELGHLRIDRGPTRVTVTNLPPQALAGADATVDHDATLVLRGMGLDTASDQGRLQYRWNFSDGESTGFVVSSQVTRAFPSVTVLEATLTVRDPHGAEASDSLTVTVVNVPPTAFTGPDMEAREDEELTFAGGGNDTPSHATGLKYSWDFGDGTVTGWYSKADAFYTYVATGVYVVTLSVRDPERAVAEAELIVNVTNVMPSGAITNPSNGTTAMKDQEVMFEARGTDTISDLATLMYLWDFGDDASKDWDGEPSATHIYVSSGEFEVTLYIRDDDWDTFTVRVGLVIVNEPPVATLLLPVGDQTVAEDTKVTFRGKGSDTPSDIALLSMAWMMDGLTFEGEGFEHTFDSTGVYTVLFIAIDPEGASSQQSVTIQVENVAPEVSGEVNRTLARTNETFSFNATLFDTASDIGSLAVLWEFGDGATADTVSAVHSYASPGEYTVTLTVTDDDGSTAQWSQVLTVTAPPPPPPPPPSDGEGDDGGGGVPGWLPYAAVLVAVVAVLVALLLLTRRGDRR